jgi:hypothetical protein
MEELIKVLPVKLKELQVAEYNYDRRYNSLFLQSGMGTIVAKEAEAKSVCDEEGLFSPLADLRGELKALYIEKDLLTEMSRNLRTISEGR